MSTPEITQMAVDARELGYTPKTVINRLHRIIGRNHAYLEQRRSKGVHTSHDEITAEDIVMLALTIELLESQLAETKKQAGSEET